MYQEDIHIILVGPMASGKTSVSKELETLGFRRIITYTTREPRADEVNGIDYHFVSNEDFYRIKRSGKYSNMTQYRDGDSKNKYGALKSDLLKPGNSVIVLSPQSEDPYFYVNKKPFIVWLDPPYSELLKRAEIRGVDKNEASKRIITESIDFQQLEESGICDLRLVNSKMDPQQLARKIFMEANHKFNYLEEPNERNDYA